MNSPKTWREILQVGWQTLGGMRTMSMAWLHLSAFIVLLLGCFHTAVTENDVTPRLTFSYSKFHNFFTTQKQPLYKLLFFFFFLSRRAWSQAALLSHICTSHTASLQTHQALLLSRWAEEMWGLEMPEAPAGASSDPFVRTAARGQLSINSHQDWHCCILFSRCCSQLSRGKSLHKSTWELKSWTLNRNICFLLSCLVLHLPLSLSAYRSGRPVPGGFPIY